MTWTVCGDMTNASIVTKTTLIIQGANVLSSRSPGKSGQRKFRTQGPVHVLELLPPLLWLRMALWTVEILTQAPLHLHHHRLHAHQ